MSTAWKPLLAGGLAAEAASAVNDILKALAQPTRASRQYSHEIALLHAYAAEALNDEQELERASLFLDDAAHRMANETLAPALHGGFLGVAWVFEVIAEQKEDAQTDNAIDDALWDLLGQSSWAGTFDLMTGLTGFGVYALERQQSSIGRAILMSVISRLNECAMIDESGYRWFTAPDKLSPGRRLLSPRGRFDLGMAHGAAGVISFLAAATTVDPGLDGARSMLTEAVRWLLSHSQAASSPSWIDIDGASAPSRSAWCYGGPGLSFCLARAARVLDREDLLDTATDIARNTVRRSEKKSGVVDGGLCHGAAGLAHVLNRLAHETGCDEIRQGAVYWYQRCLQMRTGGGIAGFRSLHPSSDGKGKWESSPSLLTGVAGVGLALLSAISEVRPDWDRILLPRPRAD